MPNMSGLNTNYSTATPAKLKPGDPGYVDPTVPNQSTSNPNGVVALSAAAKSGAAVPDLYNTATAPAGGADALQTATTKASLDWLNNPMGGFDPVKSKQQQLEKSNSDWAKTYEQQRQNYGNVSGSGLLQENMLQNALNHNVDQQALESNIDKENYNKYIQAMQGSIGAGNTTGSTNENIFSDRLSNIRQAVDSGAATSEDLTGAMRAGGLNVTAVDPKAAIAQKRQNDLYAFGLSNQQYVTDGTINKAGITAFNTATNKAMGMDTSNSGIISDVITDPANYTQSGNPQAYQQLASIAQPFTPSATKGDDIYAFTQAPNKNTVISMNGKPFVVTSDVQVEKRSWAPNNQYVNAIDLQTGQTTKIYANPDVGNSTGQTLGIFAKDWTKGL
jgi:hypothetical protein